MMDDHSTRGSRPTPYLVAQLREVLAHDPSVAALDLQLRIVGDDVFVTGTVSSPERRDAVERVLHGQVPDLTLHNQIAVLTTGAPTGHEDIV